MIRLKFSLKEWFLTICPIKSIDKKLSNVNAALLALARSAKETDIVSVRRKGSRAIPADRLFQI